MHPGAQPPIDTAKMQADSHSISVLYARIRSVSLRQRSSRRCATSGKKRIRPAFVL